ncbi:hypothetical protein G6722_06615 [Polynucleobacter paneuropaeus]|jgi:hypothetical protein|nr:hypothetical protein [Polynucleobacter paneuropaeus]
MLQFIINKMPIRLFLLLMSLSLCTNVHAEWINYYDPAYQEFTMSYSTLSLRRFDETHYSVTVLINYKTIQTAIVNKQTIYFRSKSQQQLFECESQEFALGNYELYEGKDGQGEKTLVDQKELVWKLIPVRSLQMEFLKSFCARR